MSTEYYLQRFEDGAGVDADASAIRAVLDRFSIEGDERGAVLRTADGQLDVYGHADCRSLMVTEPEGREAWDVIFALADAGGMVIMASFGGTFLPPDVLRADLPDGLPEPIVVVSSGAELLAAVQAS